MCASEYDQNSYEIILPKIPFRTLHYHTCENTKKLVQDPHMPLEKTTEGH
jgi:hypothetical protein